MGKRSQDGINETSPSGPGSDQKLEAHSALGWLAHLERCEPWNLGEQTVDKAGVVIRECGLAALGRIETGWVLQPAKRIVRCMESNAHLSAAAFTTSPSTAVCTAPLA